MIGLIQKKNMKKKTKFGIGKIIEYEQTTLIIVTQGEKFL
jgi:hypothetical protein